MNLAFLTPAAAAAEAQADAPPPARTPMEHAARAAGARFEVRGGWNVARFDAPPSRVVSWADACALGKLELQGAPAALADLVAQRTGGGGAPAPGTALRAAGAWWCPVTPGRLLVLSDPGVATEPPPRTRAVDVTASFAALTVTGPQAREAIARCCALDLRPGVTPVGGFRPGSVARTPGFVLRESADRYLLLTGAALGHHLWTVVADAAGHLGGAPATFGALDA
jgi:sarcosine oxidase gamma subunit